MTNNEQTTSWSVCSCFMPLKKKCTSSMDWETKTRLRQEKATPILFELKHWMSEQMPLVILKSPLGQATAYALPRWEGLSAYALHSQLEIDRAANRNKLAENAIRPLAIGRMAFLFSGSHQAAEMTAAIYSFMTTCKKNGADEQQWLSDVLERIQSHKHKDLYQLLPNNWLKYRKQHAEQTSKII